MGYEAQNNMVVQRAFDNLRFHQTQIVTDGMRRVAEAGLEYLLEAHDTKYDLNHPEETNTLGYAVAYNGNVVASGSHNGGDYDMPGSAREMAENIAASSPGWCAIILSEMEGYYRVDWEMDFLYRSTEEIKANFNQFFKPIAA